MPWENERIAAVAQCIQENEFSVVRVGIQRELDDE